MTNNIDNGRLLLIKVGYKKEESFRRDFKRAVFTSETHDQLIERFQKIYPESRLWVVEEIEKSRTVGIDVMGEFIIASADVFEIFYVKYIINGKTQFTNTVSHALRFANPFDAVHALRKMPKALRDDSSIRRLAFDATGREVIGVTNEVFFGGRKTSEPTLDSITRD